MQVNPIEVQRYLAGVDYPAGTDELVSRAEENGAPGEVVEQLRSLVGREFDSPAAVMEALG